MIAVEVEVMVDLPAAKVFSFVTDLCNEPKWWRGVTDSQRIAGDGGVGSVYRLESSLLGIRDTADIEVTAQDPPHRQTIVVRRGKLPYTAYYHCTEVSPDRTAFRLAAQIEAVRPWSWFGPLLRPLLLLVLRRYFRDLPRIIVEQAG